MVGSVVNPEHIAKQLKTIDIPVVAFSQRFEEFHVDYVVNDNYSGAMVVDGYIYSNSDIRHIAHISGLDTQMSSQERYGAIRML